MQNIIKIAVFAYILAGIIAPFANAQSINISNFYYRDFLDFGQNKGVFKEGAQNPNGVQITGKDGTEFSIPNVPNFSASSNYGSLTSVGRGFVVTANHVSSPESIDELRQWGLTKYNLASQPLESNNSIMGISKPYGRDEKFLRLNKYIIEGQASMLNIANSTKQGDTSSIANEAKNLETFKNELEKLKDSNGNVYIYQAGSGIMDLRWSSNPIKNINLPQNGSMKGGGFGILGIDSSVYENLVYQAGAIGDSRGILYYYNPSGDFNNRITSGDSGSGIYAFDSKNNKWILLGVTSRATSGVNRAEVSFVSNKDFADYQQHFEQNINLNGSNFILQKPVGSNLQLGNTTLQNNKDLIFSGGGSIEVKSDIDRMQSGYAGGFVFANAETKTTYNFTNESGKNYFFKGSGLDIGQNVEVEWHLHNQSGDSLHKIGQGTLIIKTNYTPTNANENLGYLKIGEGKVTLDTDKKAFENIYITSGRGALELKNGKAEAIGALKVSSGANGANSYTLSQSKSSEMGIYFGSGGGVLDLGGNSLKLNTIAANDKNAILTNSATSAKSTLEIEGFGYADGNKTTNKADTIIHASIGISPYPKTQNVAEGDKGGGSSNQNGNLANIDIIHKGNKTTQNTHPQTPSAREGAFLIFDGNINSSGSLSVENANIALQGHATTHAIISDATIREQIKNAEAGTSKAMPEYMDLSKPSTLNQPDWDDRIFKFTHGITLTNANLTLGRNATLESHINASGNSTIKFGGGVKHFIDNKDGANINGSGFGYYQKVEGGDLSDEMQEIANQTIHYKGKITANGGSIQSSIWDFNASLDLQNGAKLEADFLTIEKSNTIKLDSKASANIKNLKLQNLSQSDLSNIFDNNTANNARLKVTQKFIFDSVESLDLAALDSIHIDKTQNYDIEATKSSITSSQKSLVANVSLFDSATLSAQSLTLKDTNGNAINPSTNPNALKNLVYLDSSQNNASQNPTKLTLSENLKAENLEKAQVILWGKSEISTPKIEFDNVKNGILLLDSEATLTNANNQNTNVKVNGNDSTLNIFLSGDKKFDINASGANAQITLNTIPSDFTPAPSDKPSENMPSVNFSGKISASSSSVVDTTALDSITSSVDLSGSANLIARNITLDSTHNAINLQGTSTLSADTINAKNLSQLTLNVDSSANVNVKNFIFEGGNITSGLSTIIGDNITLKNGANIMLGNDITLSGKKIILKSTQGTQPTQNAQSTTLKATNLTFNGADSSIITADKDSKLEITNLKVASGNLTLNLADSSANAKNIATIDLSSGGSININSWDFGNNTTFSSNGNGRAIFENVSYTQNSTKTIGVDSTINGNLTLDNVGKTQNATTDDSRFETLKFENKNLSFGENAKINITLDSSVKKGGANLTLDKYYTILSAGSVSDNRADKRIDFHFGGGINELEKLYIVSKFDNNALVVKFLESNPSSFSELSKHIKNAHTQTLKALIEHNPNDENIDIAARTESYSKLESTLSKYENTMQEIARQNSSQNISSILQNSQMSAQMRIMQVRLASKQNPTQNPIMQKIATASLIASKSTKKSHAKSYNAINSTQSDFVNPSDELESSLFLGGIKKQHKATKLNPYPNSAWASALGGYAGSAGLNLAFYGASVGYDRLINNTILGVMASFGGSVLLQKSAKQNGIITSGGVYLHTQFSKSEFESNLSFAYNSLESSAFGDNLKSSVFGGLWSNYYKYNISLLNEHILKPVIIAKLGLSKGSDWRGEEFRGDGFSDIFGHIGAGLEYVAFGKNGFYTLGFSGVQKIHSQKSAQISFAKSSTMLDFIINNNAFEAQGFFIGTHSLNEKMTIQYGIYLNGDTRGYYGTKGTVAFKYCF
ncbi:S6 family peptidase [Helicobacter sp. T3_23-1056]